MLKKDIWTVCNQCRMSFAARSPDAPYCSDCLGEMTDRNGYERIAWKEE